MRLNEFADPKHYIEIIADADDLPSQLEKIWPRHDTTFVPRLTKQQGDQKPFNASFTVARAKGRPFSSFPPSLLPTT